MLMKPVLSYLLLSVFWGSAYSLPSDSNVSVSVSERAPNSELKDLKGKIDTLDKMTREFMDNQNKLYPQVKRIKEQIDEAYKGYMGLYNDTIFLVAHISQVKVQAGYVD